MISHHNFANLLHIILSHFNLLSAIGLTKRMTYFENYQALSVKNLAPKKAGSNHDDYYRLTERNYFSGSISCDSTPLIKRRERSSLNCFANSKASLTATRFGISAW